MATTTKTATKANNTKTKEIVMEDFKTIADILIFAQKSILINKDLENDFGGFNYYRIDDILNQFKKILLKFGAFSYYETESLVKGERYYIKATFKIDWNGQHFEATSEIREPATKPKMDDSQVSRSATTQAKKTILENILLLSDGFEPDGANNNNYEYLTESEIAAKEQQMIDSLPSYIETAKKKYHADENLVKLWTDNIENDPKGVLKDIENFVYQAREKFQQQVS